MAITSTYLTTTNDQAVFEASGQQVVTTVYLCNTSGNNVDVNMYLVSNSGTTANVQNQIYSNLTIQAGNTYVIDSERLMLGDLNQIRVAANIGNTITVTVSTYAV